MGTLISRDGRSGRGGPFAHWVPGQGTKSSDPSPEWSGRFRPAVTGSEVADLEVRYVDPPAFSILPVLPREIWGRPL